MTPRTSHHVKREDLPYRPCVGLVIFNEDGQVFVGERIDTPGAWQMPQGGIDPGEDLKKAAFREMKEEIGTDNAEILHVLDQTIFYDLPDHLLGKIFGGKYRGQEQTWIALRYKGSDSDIDIEAFEEPEFLQWQWVNLEKTIDLIVPFKRDVYSQVIEAFKDIHKI